MTEKSSIRIIFMGTPEFAVASLDALVQSGYNIVAAVTAPDKPAGRGMKMNESAVKKYAVEQNIPVLQPEKLKNPEFIEALKSLNANLQIIVAFRMLPEVVWNMPPMGTINVHGSLLPQYRGAAPINWAVINGEKETGVTTFKLKHEIDTGDILLQDSFPIAEDETAGEVHDHMKEMGAKLLLKTIDGLLNGTIDEKDQSSMMNGEWSMKEPATTNPHSPFTIHHSPLKHAPKIFTETCKIDFSKPVDEVHNLIRGLSPFPGAFTTFNGKMMKIYRSKKEVTGRGAAGDLNHADHNIQAGETAPTGNNFITDSKTFLKFVCSNGYIHILELQLEGKKKMLIEDFLRGYRIPPAPKGG